MNRQIDRRRDGEQTGEPKGRLTVSGTDKKVD
jgi:hypothetical protein